MHLLIGDPEHARRGSALVTTLLVVFTLMVISVGFFQLGTAGERKLMSGFDDERALMLAEAALNESITAMRAGATGNVGHIGEPAFLGGGVFWTQVEAVQGTQRRVTVTALVGSGRRAISAIVDGTLGEPPLFTGVLSSDEDMTLNQGVKIDSYRSSLGTYASQQVNVHTNGTPYANTSGDVQSNGDIVMNSDANVFGDATPGPGHVVTTATGTYVSGSTLPAPQASSFPPIEYPPVTPSGDYTVSGTARTLPAGDYGFGAFAVGGATLTIRGPARIVCDSFAGNRGGRILIDATDGPVTFFVRTSYTHIKGFEVDAVAGSPTAVAFMIDAAQDIVFPSLTNIRGGYYVPHSRIVFSSGNECWGAFSGQRIDMSNDMRFHFDEDLARYWTGAADDGEVGTGVLAWSEVGVQPASLLADRRDPILVLDLVRGALPSPVDAWDNDPARAP